jgi:hypothetical protein
MKSLYPFADIMTLMSKIEGNITKLSVIYTSQEERTATDESLIDSFLTKATELSTAANALKGITFTGP